MLTLLYDLCLFFISLFALPKILYQIWRKRKYRESFSQRLGFKFPSIDKKNHPLIWIHAVSVGETKAIASLAKKIQSEIKDVILIISSITETGHAEAKRAIPTAQYHVYLPLDFSPIMTSIMQKTRPDALILSETDYWYGFLSAAKASGAKVILVNGKISERSLERFRFFPFFTKQVFNLFDLMCVQSRHYLERFEQLGIVSEKLYVTGNSKFDIEYPRMSLEEKASWKEQLKIRREDQVLVLGSTHDPEEKEILEQLKQTWQIFPRLKVLIVPRHPERFQEVATLLAKEAIAFGRLSDPLSIDLDQRVILIDAMGILNKCYQLADIAIVAGSFTSKVGGHNILEPCFYGVPVLFGPYMFSQPELDELVKRYQAGIQISILEVNKTIETLLQDSEKRQQIGARGLEMMREIHGATAKNWEKIKKLLTF